MGLRNPRHERFAQELAKGNSTAAAYGLAGYRKDKSNAFRLLSRPAVRARVAEIQGQAAEQAKLTLAQVTLRLLDIVARTEASDTAAMLSVARMSLVQVARLNGLAVDPKERVRQGSLEDLLERIAAEDAAEATGEAGHV